jgi:hypothetical protein
VAVSFIGGLIFMVTLNICYCQGIIHTIDHTQVINWWSLLRYRYTGADPGGVGAHPARAPPLKLEKIWFFGTKSWFFKRNTPKIFAPPSAIGKNMIFWRKSWFFTRNTPNNFAPPSARRYFFKCAPSNLKSWIRPWYILINKKTIDYKNKHYFVHNYLRKMT